jgi:hypothetical protein
MFALWQVQTGNLRLIFFVLTSCFWLIWIISYFCAVCSSPGYLPFYWAVEKKEVFTYEEQLDGIITTTEQYNFAHYNQYPERGSLSKQARRLVLKADHICPWIANWVGLKNYRYFFVKLIWSFIYFIDWFLILILNSYELSKGWKLHWAYIGTLVLFFPMFGFFGFIVVMIVRHTRYTCHNTSTLQELKLKDSEDKHNYYDLGCWRNFVAIFGPAYCCPCWFFPVPIKRVWGGYHWETNRERPPPPEIEP